jgi:hypothetical protein
MLSAHFILMYSFQAHLRAFNEAQSPVSLVATHHLCPRYSLVSLALLS